MSLLTDTIFSGAISRLHSSREGNGRRNIRKSKSHGGLFSPLVRLARDPIGALNAAANSQLSVPEETDSLGADANHRQILYLRMQNVGTWHWLVVIVTC
jgi:TAG lipase/steryl ester hydrolase/phospholipase A2/LPA acyltransferase